MDDTPEKTVKLEDLARQAGVSVSTVSRALSGSPAVNSETRRRIRALAESANYDAPVRRSRAASTKAEDRPVTVVMAPTLSGAPQVIDPFSLGLLGGISVAMRERGLDFAVSHVVPFDQSSLVEFVEQNQSEGLIFLGQSQLHATLNRLARDNRRFVVWGAATQDQAYCSVGSDNLRGGQLATSHLIRLGRRRIAFIGDIDTIELRQRLEGYETALREAGLEPDPRLHRLSRLTPDAAMEAIDDLLDQGVEFDAIVAAADLVAVGAMRALHRRGVSVPGDVAVVGYDDIEIAAHTHPALTTIRQDTAKAGRLLVAKVMRMLAGQQAASERLMTELIVRESCGA